MPSKRRAWRRVLWVAGAFLALAALSFGLLHAGFVRRWALDRAVSALANAGIVLRAGRLDYNVATLTAHLHDVHVASPDTPDTPFFTAREVGATLGWDILFGRIDLKRLEIVDSRIVLAIGADGRSNWPSFRKGTDASSSPRRFRVQHVRATNLRFLWQDARANTTLETAVSLEATHDGDALSGPIAMSGPARLRWKSHETTFTSLATRFSWNDRDLRIDGFSLAAPEATLQASGRIANLAGGGASNLDVRLKADLNLDAIAPWLDLDGHIGGMLHAESHVVGPLADPVATVQTKGTLTSDRLPPSTVDATLRLAKNVMELSSLRAQMAGGSLTGRGRMAAGGAGSAHLTWDRLSLPVLITSLAPESSVVPLARSSGSLDAAWAMPRLQSVELTARASAASLPDPARTRPSARGPNRRQPVMIAVDGKAQVGLRRGRWTLTSETQVFRAVGAKVDVNGALNLEKPARSSVRGTMQIDADDLARLSSELVAAGLVAEKRPLGGAATGRFVVGGTLEAPSLDGDLDARLRYAEYPPLVVRSHASATVRDVALSEIDARMDGSVAQGAIRWSTRSDEIAGTLNATVLLEDVVRLSGGSRPVAAGPLAIASEISGRLSHPRAAVTASGSGLSVVGQPIDRLSAELGVDGSAITIDRLRLESGGGSMSAHGSIDPAARTYSANVTADAFPIGPVPREIAGRDLPIAARLSGTIDSTGSFDQPAGRGRVTLDDARWSTADLGHVTADVSLANREATYELEGRDLALNAVGTVGLDGAFPFAVRGRWEPRDLAALAERLGIELPSSTGGTASLRADLTGTFDDLAATRGQVDLDAVNVTLAGQPIQLSRPGHIDYDGRTLHADNVTFATGASTLVVNGRFGERGSPGLTLTLDGSLSDFAFIREIWQTRVAAGKDLPPPAGAIHLDVAAEGTIEQPVLSGALRITEGQIPVTGQQSVTGVDLNLTYREGLLAVERASAAFEGATLGLSGRIPSDLVRDRLPETVRRFVTRAGGPATLSAKITGITPAVAAPFVAPGALDEIDAHIDGSIDLEADRAEIDRIRGSILLSRADVSLAGVAFTQQTMTRLGVHDGRVDVESWDWRQAENRITLEGGATIDDAPVLDLTARASLDASVLNALVPAARVGGRAEANIRFEGPAANPAINGRVTIQDGETRVTNPRLIVSNLNGAIVLAGDTLTLEQMTANVNGGDLTITGSIRHRAFRPVDGTITFDGTDVSFDSSGLRAEADPNLTLTFEPRGPVLAGTVTVKRSSFRGVRSLTGGMFDFSRRRSTARRNADSPLGNLRLDVRVVTEEDLLVDIPQAQLSAAADVRVVGTVARPSLAGRVTLPEGGLLFLGVNRLRLSEQGTIDFNNPNVIEPNLNLTAVTRVQGTEITLRLQGMPPDIQMPLTSDDPQLSQADLVSLLVSGRTAAEAADEGVVPGGELVVGLLAGQLLGAAGSVVGLETVRVERGTPDVRFDAGLVATETDPGARLTIGTNVGSRTEVVLSQSLEESGDLTWIVSYAALPPLRLRVVSQDDGQRLYGFQHEISSGSAQGSKRRADAEAPIVRDVIVTGAGSDEAEIRSRLEVKPGDRFSLFEWQDDRERLEDYYRDQRRLEARVVTRRAPSPDDPSGLQLTYTITPGPRTTLVVEGFDPSKATRRAIDDAWAGVVVDDFLIEEATNLLRSELADDGFLLPSIAATVERGADEKRLRIRVDPGQRASDRRIEFTGNLQIPSNRLRTLLAEQGLDRQIWLDPEPAREALVNFYRDSGYLDATVTIGPISNAGRSVVRTAQIEEGALFRLSSIRLQGVSAVPAEDVTKAAALSPGSPFTEAEMERARVAVDNLYRTRGFNTVNVELTADPLPDHAEVVVVVTIDEGPQQLLREIVTTGLERARPQVVSQALRLDVGQPVDLAAWNAARQRLYETGVFRSVDIEREPIAVPAASAPAAAEGTTEEPVRAVITVQEWPFLRWRYGLDLEDNPPPTSDSSATVGVEASSGRTFGIGVASDLRARTLFGRTLSAGVAGRYSTDFEAIRFYTTTPLFFGQRITTNAFVERSREDIGTTSISDITSMTVEQRLRPMKRVELSYRYTYERESSIDQVTRAETPLPLDSTVATTGVLDFRNNLINTTIGWFHSSSLEYAPAALGSELPFVKYLLQQRYYRSAGPVVFASSGRLGLATAFGQDLTASDRFVAGGGNSVRGYDQDQLSPFDAAGEPGGSPLFVFNQEVRFPIFKWVRGVWFFDAGRAFPRVENLSFSDLSTSTGIGLRVHTPFILFRVDYGVPLDNRVTPEGSGWYFSIGQMF